MISVIERNGLTCYELNDGERHLIITEDTYHCVTEDDTIDELVEVLINRVMGL